MPPGASAAPAHHFPNPVEHTKDPAAENSIEDDRSGNLKDSCPDAEYPALFLEFNGRSRHGIGKSGDGYKSSCPGEVRKFLVQVQAGEQDTEENKGKSGVQGRGLFIHPIW